MILQHARRMDIKMRTIYKLEIVEYVVSNSTIGYWIVFLVF